MAFERAFALIRKSGDEAAPSGAAGRLAMTRLALRSISVAGAAMTAGYAPLCASPSHVSRFHPLEHVRRGRIRPDGTGCSIGRGFLSPMDTRRVTSTRPVASVCRCRHVGRALQHVSSHPAGADRRLAQPARGRRRAGGDHLALRPWITGQRDRCCPAPAQSAEDANRVGGAVADSGSWAAQASSRSCLRRSCPVDAAGGQFEPDLLSTGLSQGMLWTLVTLSLVASSGFLALALLLRIVRSESMPRIRRPARGAHRRDVHRSRPHDRQHVGLRRRRPRLCRRDGRARDQSPLGVPAAAAIDARGGDR